MKNLFTLSLLLIAISASVLAQPPQAFKYQAVVRDAAGEIMSNEAVDIRIGIHNETPAGTIIYQENFTTTSNQFGLVNLNIGLGNPVIGSFFEIDWRFDSKFIEVEISLDGGVDYFSLGTSELFSVPYALYSNRSADGFWVLNNSNVCYENGNVGIGTSNPLDKLHVADHIRVGEDLTYPTIYGELIHDGAGTGFIINANAGGGGWADMHFQTNGTTKMFIESGGGVGIGTTSPSGRFTVKSSGYTSGMYVLADDDDRIFRIRQMSGGGGGIYAFDGADNATILLNGEGSCWINSGNLGVGTSSPQSLLHVNGTTIIGSTAKGIKMRNTGTMADIESLGTDLAINYQSGENTVMNVVSGNVGIGTASPQSKLDVRGNLTIRNASTGDIAIELGTGLDYAEGFNVCSNTVIQPGTVLSIDPDNPGKLKTSEKPYDKTVAGIVAGANGLGSGIRLGTQEFDCNVALAGRVYCNTIATTEDIEPGDLLTTSSIPGYAMKVTNFKNSQGAILGKAMESLEKGKKGQILVLVTLQ